MKGNYLDENVVRWNVEVSTTIIPSHSNFYSSYRNRIILMMFRSCLLSFVLAVATATDINCEICRAVSDAVERVLVLNSTSSDTYTGVAKRSETFQRFTELQSVCGFR